KRLLLENRTEDGKYLCHNVTCGSYGCPHCGWWLRYKNAEYTCHLFGTESRIWVLDVERPQKGKRTEWDRIRRGIKNDGGEYASFRLDDRRIRMWTNVPPDTHGAVEMTPSEGEGDVWRTVTDTPHS